MLFQLYETICRKRLSSWCMWLSVHAWKKQTIINRGYYMHRDTKICILFSSEDQKLFIVTVWIAWPLAKIHSNVCPISIYRSLQGIGKSCVVFIWFYCVDRHLVAKFYPIIYNSYLQVTVHNSLISTQKWRHQYIDD